MAFFIGGPLDGMGQSTVFTPQGTGPVYRYRFGKATDAWLDYAGDTPFFQPKQIAVYRRFPGEPKWRFWKYEWVDRSA